MTSLRRWFGALLWVFPPGFRERHGDDMRRAFDDACAERAAEGRLTFLVFLARTTLDIAGAGIRERLRVARTPDGGPRFEPTRGSLISWLDVKLGARMLFKHPGLTLVSTLALAIGVPVGLAPAHFVDGLLAPLPVPEGDRIRALRLWSPEQGRAESTTQFDLLAWRPELSSFDGLGAVRETAYNVDAEEGGEGVSAASVTASAFTVVRTEPLLGRTFRAADEVPGAENVVIVGYDLWQSRYGGDPSIIGRSIRLGRAPHTVVGVMPEGFRFPERQSLWTPLRVTAAGGPGDAVSLWIFGRLADGVTDEMAQAEFSLVAGRSSVLERDPRSQPQVVAYAYGLLPGLQGGLRSTPEFLAFQSLALIVLLVACANVAMLIFARTSTRATELAVRTALGADRRRVVAQVFTECLVLAVLASGVGLLLMALCFDVMWRFFPARFVVALPYWIDWGLSARTIGYALGLGALSAIIAGVVPAIYFTGRSVQSTIQRARARKTGARFGGLSGVLIAVDVAVAVGAVGFAAAAFDQVRAVDRAQDAVGIPAEEFLAVGIRLPAEVDGVSESADRVTDRAVRMATAQQEMTRRLLAEPNVRTVAVADFLPRMEHRIRRVEAEGIPASDGRRGVSSRAARVDIDYFQSLGRPILDGRDFDAGDLGEDRSAVMVNTTFVERVLQGQSPVGRRIRFVPWGDGEPGPWKEIVGVVGHLGMRMVSKDGDQGVYEPFAPGEVETVRFGIHVGTDPVSFAPRVRELAGEVDPEALVDVIGSLGEVYEGDWYLLGAASFGGGLLVFVLLALAASGIYAMMSFAVTERTREIGIRAALGAGQPDLVRSIAKRSVAQLGVGVVLGAPLAAVFFASSGVSLYEGAASSLVVGIAVLVFVGLVACSGPTLRALRIDPSEALGREG